MLINSSFIWSDAEDDDDDDENDEEMEVTEGNASTTNTANIPVRANGDDDEFNFADYDDESMNFI